MFHFKILANIAKSSTKWGINFPFRRTFFIDIGF